MITQDRIELNDRFRKVFKLLEERGVIVKNDRNGKGMGDFAKKILGKRGYGHIIRAYLNPDDKRCISYSQARTLCREYSINQDYLLDGIGTPFGFDLPGSSSESAPTQQGNILFTNMEAFAGASIDKGHFTHEANDFFRMPGLSGSGLVAFPINGNSMEPVINDGDIVICREINGIDEIKDNEIYAIKNNGNIWVKYVQRIPNNKGRVAHLKLVSANHLEHDPFTEEVNEHTRLYKVIKRVSDI